MSSDACYYIQFLFYRINLSAAYVTGALALCSQHQPEVTLLTGLVRENERIVSVTERAVKPLSVVEEYAKVRL